jgi:hypothetical protein
VLQWIQLFLNQKKRAFVKSGRTFAAVENLKYFSMRHFFTTAASKTSVPFLLTVIFRTTLVRLIQFGAETCSRPASVPIWAGMGIA